MTGPHGVPEDVVVVDTDVYSRVYVRAGKTDPGKQIYKDALVGRTVSIAVQTRAELLTWPAVRAWSRAREAQLRAQLASTPTIPVTDAVIEAFVRLSAECTRAGHALGRKDHVGDRWVAATAVAVDRPVLAVDGIYDNVPGLARLVI